MKKLAVGILAHVDAGKTTLSEGMLYLSGKIQTLGRVDKKDAYLDTHDLERKRGITIFSKQAIFDLGDTEITLLDTPGHVDFSTEMERTLRVLDYAILVISGADGVQGHTKTVWQLLSLYNISVFLFVNKMDQPGTSKSVLLEKLKDELSEVCVDFSLDGTEQFYEELALCHDDLMDDFINNETIDMRRIIKAISERKVFPCFFGSALKLEGVGEFMEGLSKYTEEMEYPDEFGAQVFKISRDEQGQRLTHLKVIGGSLEVRDPVISEEWEDKVNEIRLYSGERYEIINSVGAGSICAVTGLSQTRPGEGLGIANHFQAPILEPVLAYQVRLPKGIDAKEILPKLREIEEEDPELRIIWNEELQEVQVQLMGEVQIEILQSLIKRRFGIAVQFDAGEILYKETITNTVEGVGHFEPLRHYAEVLLLLEPTELGSGLQYVVECSEDLLPKNLQRLILTHLKEKVHRGVLTGSPITDLKITLIGARYHLSHTQGGDFREATYRAVRQGLKMAKSTLLEPYYSFQLEVPETAVGKAITDIERMQGVFEIGQASNGTVILEGSAPVVNMQNYHREVRAYTKGAGTLSCSFYGYKPCHNQEEVVVRIGYNSEKDLSNPTGSVFCSQGSGFYVPWDKVRNYMHLDSSLPKTQMESHDVSGGRKYNDYSLHDDMGYEFLEGAGGRNRGEKQNWKKRTENRTIESPQTKSTEAVREDYLLVDGYNVIHQWPELKEFADEDMDIARIKLLDALASYQGIRMCKIIVVFDAYRVPGHLETVYQHHNIHVVFTKEAQTADEYIEKFAHDFHKRYNIKVATSDGLQQVIIRGAGSTLLSAGELREEVKQVAESLLRHYSGEYRLDKTPLEDVLSSDIMRLMIDLKEGN